ncbi:UDP-N-acetylmuramate--L-alanine ligase [Epidermidibacterium keratini]|uniref:UDP-N-acetylmuramate--L-alanine ligase n=1 Tax=Epidermidibacterium keratini TaxID=1891644 RepID=A0A7L4YI45_9ACTN|nr:UDP-N-acetylmuramate--L-alanine ligase [Epidermidibacterium keratini]QHB99140.1 UDP-N-acetylmuramate--L-alanine ligase [Epidermidibacterium keratini]
MSDPVLPAYAEPGVTRRPDELGAVHFIGIGGAGMSAIAHVMLALGVPVSGSDARESAVLAGLRAAGATCFVGHDAAHVGDQVQTVVVSSAIRESNPELQVALSRGLLILPRVQALASVMSQQRGVAVAGTHGKTSTTSMLVSALDACDADPSFAIGGALTVSGSGAHHGRGDVFAVEADESDGSFLLLEPYAGIITNIEADHLDNYGDFDGVLAAFERFTDTVRGDGFLVVCGDDEPTRDVAGRAAARGVRVISYGESAEADLRLSEISVGADGTTYRADGLGLEGMQVRTAATGHHMALNSAAVLATGIELGYAADCLASGLATFGGVGRRMELRGEAGGVRVFDDYAHHPTEVRAQLAAARAVAGEGRLVVAFQPHLFSRTKAFAREFGEALGLADAVVVMDVYAAREDPDPEVTGALISDQVPAGRPVVFEPQWSAAPARIVELAQPGDVVMTVGAGDVTDIGPLVLELLRAR